MNRAIVAILLALAFLVSACGVRAQSEPDGITLEPSQEETTQRPVNPSPATAEVFFIRGNRLEPVNRGVPDQSESSVLQALAAGPTRSEVLGGIRTAIPPQRFRVTLSEVSSNVAVVQVGEGFASISGENQLMAVAQVVWTLTGRPGVDRARLELSGEPVEVPTDRGLVGYPVSREDFSSVRPAGVELSELADEG